jgi:membrane associated rhomboid family serine protease
MGFADRDYYRTDRRGPGASGFAPGVRGFFAAKSVTFWIIVVCAAIFVLDRTVLPAQRAPTGEFAVLNEELWSQYDRIPKEQLRVVEEPAQRGSPFVHQQVLFVADGRVVPVVMIRLLQVPFFQKYLQFTTAQALMYPSATRGLDGFEFWRFFGYQFLHANAFHIALNMLGLWMFGRMVEEHLGGKRFLAFYLLCGLFGALFYMLLNAGGIALLSSGATWIPPFLPNSPYLPLIGASASVYGVLMAGAYLAPNDQVLLFFVLPVRLKTLAFGLIVIAVATLLMQGNNAGGEAAHLGGALAGFWFIRRPHQLHGFFDFLGRADPTSRSARKRRAEARKATDDAEIDRILAKIRAQGMQSLDEREKRTLRDSSKG